MSTGLRNFLQNFFHMWETEDQSILYYKVLIFKNMWLTEKSRRGLFLKCNYQDSCQRLCIIAVSNASCFLFKQGCTAAELVIIIIIS